MADVAELLRSSSEKDLRAYKRARQALDLESVRSGSAISEQMSWFSGGRARAARLVASPY